jgi:chloramphenicol-sensitive protein RarD
VYWKLLLDVGALEILSHRIVWSLVLLGLLVVLRREWRVVRDALGDTRMLRLYAVAATLLAINWGTYIWAVNAGQIVETSLGYYINPLFSVLLGVVFLQERMRRVQWFAIGLALCGVAQLTWYYGKLPWIALILATTFGLYGLTKKLAPLGALPGLMVETCILSPVFLGYLIWLETQRGGAFGHGGPWVTFLLVFAGVVTSTPLLLFAIAVRSVPLSTLGLMQYVAPTCGLIIGVFAYHEPFPRGRATGFALIWVALALYWIEGFIRMRQRAAGLSSSSSP